MGTGNNFVTRARSCCDPGDLQAVYAEWADTYDDDLRTGTHNYVAPSIVAETACRLGDYGKGRVLDAGCGTGLVGAALAAAGAAAIHGLDVSPHMLRVAERSGAYQAVFLDDLTREISRPSQFYDLVTCVGTFTHGHVGPIPALRELVRVVRANGHIVATILEGIWLPGGFETEIDKMQAEGLIRVVSSELKHYLLGQDKAYVLVLQRCDAV
ncbi:putative methyltransferase type 11 [Rosellinia necatrix]|uniref:Putative methyltransferase type 11 n=1 Tax=Rosellinia necatrix TaxID=77044 RepID=A0A1W2TXH5_ROSNE|nr:putative methyltransferase type 11 [Rosellinia necatrix]